MGPKDEGESLPGPGPALGARNEPTSQKPPLVSLHPCSEGLQEVTEEKCLGVLRLRPGHCTQLFSLPTAQRFSAGGQVEGAIQPLFHLPSQVPLGICLSGGGGDSGAPFTYFHRGSMSALPQLFPATV